MRFVQHTPEDQKQMLETIGMKQLSDLFSSIPAEIRLKHDLQIPPPLSEPELLREFRRLAGKNYTFTEYPSFLGAGIYYHHVPSYVDQLSNRGEFLTAYTPYQGEASQGMLQIIFEFQTLISRLTGLPVANASLYDASTACAEAVLLALTEKKKANKIVVSGAIHPHYFAVIRTYLKAQGELVVVPHDTKTGQTDLEALRKAVDAKTAGVLFQTPNFFGCLEDAQAICDIAHQAEALAISCHYPVALGLIAPPGEFGADIAVGEMQSFGTYMAFGGAHCGFMATQADLIRKIPGRLVGETKDSHGRRAFVLTLQTREQHIKRERATSNICTNQALIALRSTIHMCALGKQGLLDLANLCLQKAHYASERFQSAGYRLRFSGPFFNEFVLETKQPALQVNQKLLEAGILGGFPLSNLWPEERNSLMLAFTELHTVDLIEQLLAKM